MNPDLPEESDGKPAPKTAPKLTPEERKLRDEQILNLFISGHSNTSIARHYGITPERVGQIIKESLKSTAPHRELMNNQALSVYVTRLETLIQAAWEKVEVGDLKAIEVARRLLEQQAKLYGLHDPVGKGTIPPMSDEELVEDEPEDELAAFRTRYKPKAGAG